MEELAKLPKDNGVLYADDDGGRRGCDLFDAMKKANIKGALVGVEAVTRRD